MKPATKIVKTWRVQVCGTYPIMHEYRTYELEAKNKEEASDIAIERFEDEFYEGFDDIEIDHCVFINEKMVEVHPPRCSKTLDMFNGEKNEQN